MRSMTHLPNYSGNCTDGSLVLMMRAISAFGIVNQILVAGANHLKKGLVTVVRRTLHIIPDS